MMADKKIVRGYPFFIMLFILFSCSNSKDNVPVQEKKMENQEVEQLENGHYRLFYEGTNQLKMEGVYDSDNQRHGVWTYYTPEGKTQAVTEYQHGKKHGYAIVYHPNGALYYRGEWHKDQQVGKWDYYDPKTGNKVNTKEYDSPKKAN